MKHPLQLLSVFMLLCIGTLAAHARQAEKHAPTGDVYLGYEGMTPIRSTYRGSSNRPWSTGKAVMLGKSPEHALFLCGFQEPRANVTFKLGGKYARFRASVGVQSSYAGMASASFAVTGINAAGESLPSARYTSPYVSVTNAPIEIDINVTGVEELTLSVLTVDGYFPDTDAACWGNARLVTSGASGTAAGVDSGVSIAVDNKILRYDSMQLRSALNSIVERVVQKFKIAPRPTIALAPFFMNSLPNQNLSTKNADDMQTELKVALSHAEIFDIISSDQALLAVLKQSKVQVGDTFDEATRKELGKLVGADYLLLGKISDKEDHFTIYVSIYNLQTGISKFDEQQDIKTTTLVIPSGVPVKDPASESQPTTKYAQISLIFNPPTDLRIERYEWLIDGDSQRTTRTGEKLSTSVSVLPGQHHFKLMWRGNGYVEKNSNMPRIAYQNVTVEFDADISMQTGDVELNARVEDILSPRLLLSTAVGGKRGPKPAFH